MAELCLLFIIPKVIDLQTDTPSFLDSMEEVNAQLKSITHNITITKIYIITPYPWVAYGLLSAPLRINLICGTSNTWRTSSYKLLELSQLTILLMLIKFSSLDTQLEGMESIIWHLAWLIF